MQAGDVESAIVQLDGIKEIIGEYVKLMGSATSDTVKEARSRGKELQQPIIEWMKQSGVDIVDVGTCYVKLIHRKRKAMTKKDSINEKSVEVLSRYMTHDEAIKVSSEIATNVHEKRETITKETIQIKMK
jgi:hypothetical protein